MIQIQNDATSILVKLVSRVGANCKISLRKKNLPLLFVERGKSVETEAGNGELVTLTLTRPPAETAFEYRMAFILTPAYAQDLAPDQYSAFPASYEDGTHSISEISCRIEDGKVESWSEAEQRSQAAFAFHWLVELGTAGYADGRLRRW